MIKNFEELRDKLTNMTPSPKRVAVVKAANQHTLESVFELAKQGLIMPYFIDKEEEIKKEIKRINPGSITYKIIHAETDQEAAFKGVQMARENLVEFIMKGDLQTGILLKEVVNHETGIRKQEVLSHLALIEVPSYQKLIGITDGGMVLTPNIEQKKAIIENTLEVMLAIGYKKPKFAVLSSAETLQPKLPASVDAAELTKIFSKEKNIIVEGPISLDIALNKEIAQDKKYSGQIKGDSDVLVVPDIVSGNALSKSIILLAGGEMAGIIIGANVPIILTSRSSSAEEKRNSLLLALTVSSETKK